MTDSPASAVSTEQDSRSPRVIFGCFGVLLVMGSVIGWLVYQSVFVPVVHQVDERGRVLLEYSVKRGIYPYTPIWNCEMPTGGQRSSLRGIATEFDRETGEIVRQWDFTCESVRTIESPPWVRPGWLQRLKGRSPDVLEPDRWVWEKH